ncbi:MAG: NAD-dependent epimerase/dehydratase family protein [Iamia sp.]
MAASTARPTTRRSRRRPLSVAVTGPTGTFGFGLVPLLEADDRIGRIVGVARRPFDPSDHGWSKMEYRRGDVRDPAVLEEAFAGADVVIHLAFLITGTASSDVIRAINVDGTVNAFRAAAAAGARRFVYASSVAAYGFHRDNPVGMTEEWPARPADHLFYAQEKAELEALLHDEAAAHPELGLYLLRPPIVLGPHAMGAKDLLPGPLDVVGRRLGRGVARLPFRLPVLAPDVELQLIHEDDVGRAFVLCAVGEGPPGTYNITGDGVVTGADVARALGLAPVSVPGPLVRGAARRLAALPVPSVLPPVTQWVEALSHPAIMDASKARRDLGWEPQFSAQEALDATFAPGPG